LAGGDRLRGRELAVERVEVLAEDRHPAGEVEPLVGEDDCAHPDADHEQHDDRDEVLDVLADRGSHGLPPLPAEANGFRRDTSSSVSDRWPCPEVPLPLLWPEALGAPACPS